VNSVVESDKDKTWTVVDPSHQQPGCVCCRCCEQERDREERSEGDRRFFGEAWRARWRATLPAGVPRKCTP